MINKTLTLLLSFSLSFGVANLPRIEFGQPAHDHIDTSLPDGVHYEINERRLELERLINEVPQNREAIKKELTSKILEIGGTCYVTDFRLDPDHRIIYSSSRVPMPQSFTSKALEAMHNVKSLVGQNITENHLKAALITYGAYNVPYLNKVVPYLLQVRFLKSFLDPQKLNIMGNIDSVDIALVEQLFNVRITPTQPGFKEVSVPFTFNQYKTNLFFNLLLMISLSCPLYLFNINAMPSLVTFQGSYETMLDCNKLHCNYWITSFRLGKRIHSAYICATNSLLALSAMVLYYNLQIHFS